MHFFTLAGLAIVAQQAAAGCANLGLEWALYNNTAGYNGGGHYPAFDPTVYKTVTPLYSAETKVVGGVFDAVSAPSVISIYGSPKEIDTDYFVLNHRGYLHAPHKGTYTFTANKVDDILLVWVGPLAYNGWNRTNAQCDASNIEKVTGTCSFSVTVTKAHTFLPLRIMFGQSLYIAGFNLVVKGPAHKTILSSRPHKNVDFVQFGCGKKISKAPKYPPFGSET